MATGLPMRPTGAALAFTMLIAIFTVHIEHGPFIRNNSYEFALVLLSAALSLVFSGASHASPDRWVTDRFQCPPPAKAALATPARKIRQKTEHARAPPFPTGAAAIRPLEAIRLCAPGDIDDTPLGQPLEIGELGIVKPGRSP